MLPRFNWPTGNGDWQPEGKVIEANAFVLLDDQGARRGIMLVREGTASLHLLDAAGQPRAALAVEADGSAAISVGNSNGCVQALLAVQETGDPCLTLGDGEGRPRASVTLVNNSVLVLACDEHGKPAASLRVRSDGTVNLPG